MRRRRRCADTFDGHVWSIDDGAVPYAVDARRHRYLKFCRCQHDAGDSLGDGHDRSNEQQNGGGAESSGGTVDGRVRDRRVLRGRKHKGGHQQGREWPNGHFFKRALAGGWSTQLAKGGFRLVDKD